MKNLVLLIVGLVVTSLHIFGCRHSPETTTEAPLLIHGATIITPNTLNDIYKADVLVRSGRITRISRTPMKAQANWQAIDGTNKYLTPGLIEGHVHLAGVPGFSLPMRKKYKEITAAYFAQLPKSYLYFGYTTVIDLNVIDRPAIEKFKRASLTPDIFDCDNALGMANGYPMAFLPPKIRFDDNPNFIFLPSQKEELSQRFDLSEHSPRRAAQRVKNAGGICLKTHYETGFGRLKNLPVPDKKLFAELTSAAQEVGLPVLAHANSYTSQKFISETAANMLVHGMWRWEKWHGNKTIPTEIKTVLDTMIKKNMGYMPTARVIGGLQDLFNKNYLQNPALEHVLPKNLIDWYKSDQGKWFTEDIREGMSDQEAWQRYQPTLHQLKLVMNYLSDNNALLLFGSDTPSSITYGNTPGLNSYLEMKQWRQYGIPLEKIFVAATLNNARAFNIDKTHGSIEIGKKAHLVLMNQSPLKSIEAYDDIDTVIVGGKSVKRTLLSAKHATH